MKTATRHHRQVALLVDCSRAYGREILSGVGKFVRKHREWSLQSEEWRCNGIAPVWLKEWKGDGIIAWLETPALAAFVQSLNVPTVDVRGNVNLRGIPFVGNDNRVVANLAAEHFMKRGFRHYAFCGFTGASYSETRSHWFQERLAQAGFTCAVYAPPELKADQDIEPETRGMLFQNHLTRWLKSLPKPVGIMTCSDVRGQQVLNICRRLDLAVPEDVAIIGVDNDKVFCELSDPPLTSVMLDSSGVGYGAAALLERMMAGEKPPASSTLIPPLGIATRRSTDVLAMDDRQLAAGARFMREHIFEDINVTDMAKAAGMSRRVFERRFAARVGRPPKTEVLRLRLEYVKELLADTDWTMRRIAEETGFKHSEYLHAVFSRKIGITPGKFRQNARGAGNGLFSRSADNSANEIVTPG